MSQEVLYSANEGVGRITFNRPEARNAFTFRMYQRLVEICKEASADPAIKVLVLSGVDETAFAAGTDISEFKKWSSAQDALDYEGRINGLLDNIERIPIPTIAAIAGPCTGGAAAIAACCDMRIAATNARFGVPIARTLGNCLSMANYVRLVVLLGQASVKDILFTGRLVDAAEALAVGLVTEVLPDFATLQTRADELARIIASHAPLTLRVTKEALRRIKEKMTPEEDPNMILQCYMSNDFKEGMDSFLNKRKPKWTGT
ncbi:MAG TPA: enoyl-CoA hydratase/isomerase family protein [Candidatus Saccharimonadales bacterium]|jgi:enoyl-CoA hydratase|nr:enoyl-CoA hydratase/isomerase family protein [Candidatus Saccharimonadales bacterium]